MIIYKVSELNVMLDSEVYLHNYKQRFTKENYRTKLK